MFEEENEVDEFIQYLVEIGALIVNKSEDGEDRYEISPHSKEVAPMLWKAHMDEIKDSIYRLWQHDMVTIEFSADGPLADSVMLTENIYDQDKVAAMPEEDQFYLEHIVNIFAKFISD